MSANWLPSHKDELWFIYAANACSFFAAARRVLGYPFENLIHGISGVHKEGYVRPVLMLVGHGVELSMKSALLANSLSIDDVKRCGHDHSKMWNTNECTGLRKIVRSNAKKLLEYAHANDLSDTEDLSHFDQDLATLHRLHTASTDFAIRYPSNTKCEKAPYPFVLLDSFHQTMDGVVKDPTDSLDLLTQTNS